MKLFGFYFGDTTSGLARWISPTVEKADRVAVPVDRTTSFRKLPCADPDALPREVEFQVEPWLAVKPEFAPFRGTEAVKPDFRKKELTNKYLFHIRHCAQCSETEHPCPIGQHILDQLAKL